MHFKTPKHMHTTRQIQVLNPVALEFKETIIDILKDVCQEDTYATGVIIVGHYETKWYYDWLHTLWLIHKMSDKSGY